MNSIEELNAAPSEKASSALGPLFEGAPRFVGRLVAGRPYRSWAELWARAREIAAAMSEAEQIELIDAHPRLGAPPGSVSALSFQEQGYDRASVDAAAAAEAQHVATEMERMNAAYERRFGFRFCVFVADRSRATLLAVMEAALMADRGAEIRRALDDVIAIAADRHRTLSRDP